MLDQHLIRVAPSGKIVTITRSASVSTDTSNSVPFGLWQQWQGSYYYYSGDPANGYQNDNSAATAGAYASGTARPDSREVTITSGIETSYYKGAYDAQHGTDRYVHQRNADGSMVVDVGATYSTADRNRQWIGTAALTANVTNFQSPQYAWSGNFNPVGSSWNMNQQSIYGEFLLGMAKGFPSSTTITVDVTGSDSTGNNVATATNTYTIIWHLPLEKNTYLGGIKTKKINKVLAVRVLPGPGTEKSLDPGRDIPYSAMIDGVSAVLDLAGQPEAAGVLDMLSKITDITDWKYQYGGDNSQKNVVNDDTEWENACVDNNETAYTGVNNIPTTLSSDKSNRPLCYMNWCIIEKATDASWYAYGYNSHGYDGVSTHPVYVHKTDMMEGQPVFIQYKNPDGTPIS